MSISLNIQKKLVVNPLIILRLGGGFCFIGHGVLALGAKAHFIDLLSTFGIDEIQAIALLKLVGFLDILVGILILFKPNKIVLRWAMIWTGLTIIAWGIHGDSLMDLFRRLPYLTTPFALLLLLYQRVLVEVNSVSDVAKSANEDQDAAIQNLDLSMICMKLMQPHAEGWSQQQCDEVSVEYKRYLTLKGLYPNESIVPNIAIDTMWHYHILDTAAYQRDCQAIFGHLLHHYPYFGMKGKEDERQFVSAFDKTKILYERTFSSKMGGANYLASFQ